VRAASLPRGPFPKEAVIIDANENPLGPCSVAREAIAEISGDCGRYSFWLTEDLAKRFAAQEGLKPEYVRPFPGSGEPLHFSVLAFTSPSRSYVTADPGYEAGMHAAKISGARVVKTALTSTYAHDVKAMLAAAPDAGLFYVCTPNNPTGTLTPHADIEYLVERKPAGAVAAALTSLDQPSVVPERKRINAAIRSETFAWLDRNGYSYVPSVSNCFMLDTKRPAKEMIEAMAARNVFIGRAWPVWPTH